MVLLNTLNEIELLDKLSAKFFIRLLIDFLSVVILMAFIYYPNYKRKDFLFTFFLFNIIIFIITYLLNKVDMSMGAAFGLFAVFSMIRYRTEGISAKDMTYLFIVIAIGLISSVSKGSFFELSLINLVIIILTFTFDGNWLIRKELVKTVTYENIENIKPENEPVLIEDLRKRTGLNIHRVSVNKIDFLKDTAFVKIYYYESTPTK